MPYFAYNKESNHLVDLASLYAHQNIEGINRNKLNPSCFGKLDTLKFTKLWTIKPIDPKARKKNNLRSLPTNFKVSRKVENISMTSLNDSLLEYEEPKMKDLKIGEDSADLEWVIITK